jgi:GNAT superfamily N-acetyltransferase
MSATIREASPDEHDALIPLLLLAEPSLRGLRYSLDNMSDAVYRLDVDGQLSGAATMRWQGDPCEIIELAIAPERQRQGLGKLFIEWLASEARRRKKSELIVGTSSTAVDNLLFYQKCGFRVDAVRRDYFWYYDEPRYENGVRVRDMIVLRMRVA